jgi:hypothetical protein
MTLKEISFFSCLFAGFFAGLLHARKDNAFRGHAAFCGLLVGLACYFLVTRTASIFEAKYVQQKKSDRASLFYLAKYIVPPFLSFLLSWLFAKSFL